MNYFQATLRKKLSKDFDIKNIAKLASINLSEDEQKELDNDLSIILEHVKALSDLKLDTEQKEIFIHYKNDNIDNLLELNKKAFNVNTVVVVVILSIIYISLW